MRNSIDNKHAPWSVAEVEILKSNTDKQVRELEKMIPRRSGTSIRQKAHFLKLKCVWMKDKGVIEGDKYVALPEKKKLQNFVKGKRYKIIDESGRFQAKASVKFARFEFETDDLLFFKDKIGIESYMKAQIGIDVRIERAK